MLRDTSNVRTVVNTSHSQRFLSGQAGGEDKESFWKVVAHSTARLPANKPIYLMGVGKWESLLQSSYM